MNVLGLISQVIGIETLRLTYVYPYVPTNTHLFVYIFLYINAFCALTCLLNAYTISKYTITCEINKKESKKEQKRGLKGKKRAMGAAHFNRLKLKKKRKKKRKKKKNGRDGKARRRDWTNGYEQKDGQTESWIARYEQKKRLG